VERRLAAILAADVVGYTRLMGADETGTLRRLTELRQQVLEPLIAEHHGRVVKLIGDGLLVEYASVVDALTCAVAWQNSVAEREAAADEDKRLKFRIGINIGDIIVEGDDIYGDGVNIAARLEGLADPDGICIARNVYNQVRDKLDLAFEDLGRREVKNMAEAVHVYRIALNLHISASTLDLQQSLALPDKPSIAVLPFENMSGDPEQEFIADGMAEEIITALSRNQWFFVIARNSSFSYRGRAVGVKRIAHELGVQYILEGSIHKADKQLRVIVQLIDAATGRHIWSERYDREIEDLFAVQDEITACVVGTIQPELVRAEASRTRRKSTPDLNVWELIIRAHGLIARFTKEDVLEARTLLREAAAKDPDSVLAVSDLAYTYLLDAFWGWSEPRAASVSEGHRLAQEAVAIDDRDSWAHTVLGTSQLSMWEHERAITRLQRAVELNPNFPAAKGYLGTALTFAGEPEKGMALAKLAIRHSPHDPINAEWLMTVSDAHLALGRYEEAIEWAKKIVEDWPSYPGAYRNLAACYAQLGRRVEAEAAMRDLLRLLPGLTVTETRKQQPFRDASHMARFLDLWVTSGSRAATP
jgi:TolB-like protein/Flp pilus assembly protein TadD